MINSVFLIGRLGQDPAIREFQDGGKIATFSVATWYSYQKQDGEWETVTEWHNVVIRGKGVDYLPDVKKGDMVAIQGENRTRSWETTTGERRFTTEVVGRIKKIPQPRQEAPTANRPPEPGMAHPTGEMDPQMTAPIDAPQDTEDDLPF